MVVSGELVDPLQFQLLNAACLANALGWLAGTLLVARVRVLEYLDAQEAAQRQAGAGGAEQQAEPEQDQRVQRERERLHVGVRVDAAEDRGQRDLLPEHEQDHREHRAARARRSSPSSMNGPRTNQFDAPTSFITSISRRREKIESRIVFAISSAGRGQEQDHHAEEDDRDHLADAEDPPGVSLCRSRSSSTPASCCARSSAAISSTSSPCFGVDLERVRQRVVGQVLDQLRRALLA